MTPSPGTHGRLAPLWERPPLTCRLTPSVDRRQRTPTVPSAQLHAHGHSSATCPILLPPRGLHPAASPFAPAAELILTSLISTLALWWLILQWQLLLWLAWQHRIDSHSSCPTSENSKILLELSKPFVSVLYPAYMYKYVYLSERYGDMFIV